MHVLSTIRFIYWDLDLLISNRIFKMVLNYKIIFFLIFNIDIYYINILDLLVDNEV